MAGSDKSKLKILHLMKMLVEETDAEHGLTMTQMIERLSEQGIDAERKSIYRDLKTLDEFGMEIVKISAYPVQYGLKNREFDAGELMLLVDSVQSSRFLTERKSKELVRAVRRLASPKQRESLQKQVHVHGRPARQDMSDFRNVDVIQQAIANKHKLSFRYFHSDVGAKKEVRDKPYKETPVCVVYADGNYYMVVFNEKHNGFANYRVDRMERVMETDEPAACNEAIKNYDPSVLADTAFGMYSGKQVSATFHVKSDAMNVVVDRFGKDADYRSLKDGTTSITAYVMESPVLFGWLCQLGNSIEIKSPPELREHYESHLRCALGTE